MLFGVDRADAGEIELAGSAVSFATPSEALRAGIAYVPEDRHQDGLVLDFSIAENVTLPILPRIFPGSSCAAAPSGPSRAGSSSSCRSGQAASISW